MIRSNPSRRVCCVIGCKNTESKNRELHFYCFPGRSWEKERRKRWIRATGRRFDNKGDAWKPTSNSRICSEHFLAGGKSNDPRNPAYNPTIFPQSVINAQMKGDLSQDSFNDLLLEYLCPPHTDFATHVRQMTGLSFDFFEHLVGLTCRTPPKVFRKLSHNNRVLMALTKLWSGLAFYDLANLFQTSHKTASRCCFEMWDILADHTDDSIAWPRASVATSRRVVVVDCLELHYEKKEVEYKALVGMSSGGRVVFLSKAFQGLNLESLSRQSGFLEMIEPGDVVIADRGFSWMKTDVTQRRAVFIKRDIRTKGQGSLFDMVRIENLMQTIKSFRVFKDSHIDWDEHLDTILHVCCVLANQKLMENRTKTVNSTFS